MYILPLTYQAKQAFGQAFCGGGRGSGGGGSGNGSQNNGGLLLERRTTWYSTNTPTALGPATTNSIIRETDSNSKVSMYYLPCNLYMTPESLCRISLLITGSFENV